MKKFQATKEKWEEVAASLLSVGVWVSRANTQREAGSWFSQCAGLCLLAIPSHFCAGTKSGLFSCLPAGQHTLRRDPRSLCPGMVAWGCQGWGTADNHKQRGERTLLSWLPLMPGSHHLLDQQTLTPLLKSAPTGDELHLACEMKIAKPLIESKLSGSSSSAQSTFAKMNDTMTVF